MESIFEIPVYADALSKCKDISTLIRNNAMLASWWLDHGGLKFKDPETTRMLYAALHIEAFIGQKKKLVGPGAILDSDEWTLWYDRTTLSNREKADAAVANLEDADFWSMLSQSWSACQPLIKNLRLNDTIKPNMGEIYYGWKCMSDRVAELPQTGENAFE